MDPERSIQEPHFQIRQWAVKKWEEVKYIADYIDQAPFCATWGGDERPDNLRESAAVDTCSPTWLLADAGPLTGSRVRSSSQVGVQDRVERRLHHVSSTDV